MSDEAKPVESQPVETKSPEAPKDGEGTKTDDVLSFLNGVLKRDFKTRDEAQRSIDNLNRMVGDNSVAELRAKAQEADDFRKVIEAYAKSEGLTVEAAKEELIKGAKEVSMEDIKPVETQKPEAKPTDDKVAEQVERLTLKLQEKDLLEAYPEAKHVLDEVKTMAKLSGKEMKEYYESSALKTAAVAAKEKEEKASETPNPNSRQGADLSSVSDLVNKVKAGGIEADRIALIEKALAL